MYVCMYICMYVCMYVRMCVAYSVCMGLCLYKGLRTLSMYVHVCMLFCLNACIGAEPSPVLAGEMTYKETRRRQTEG